MTQAVKLLSTALALATAAPFPACGGSPGPSSPSPATIQQIAGTYSGPTTDSTISPPQQVLTWTIRFSRAGNAGLFFRSCEGTVTVVQTDSSFTGSFTQGGACSSVSGQVVGGVVRPGGAITFALAGPASDPLAWTGFAQCAEVSSGTMTFTGTVSRNLLDASFSHDALIQCQDDGFVTVNVRLLGSR